jgi:hypothetical protein
LVYTWRSVEAERWAGASNTGTTGFSFSSLRMAYTARFTTWGKHLWEDHEILAPSHQKLVSNITLDNYQHDQREYLLFPALSQAPT